MKIHLVSLEDGITATGFRKIAAYIESLNPDTRVFYVGTPRYRSMWKSLMRRVGDVASFTDAQLDEIARGIANADIVAFSSMTGYADLTRALAARVRKLNPSAYLIWGGIHPIIYPADAITADVDAVCTGEGELAFAEFFDRFRRGSDFTHTANFWFKVGSQVVKNPFRPLLTASELEQLPFPKYGGEEYLYRPGRGFTRVTLDDYLANNGLGYPAIWSIGCPLHCTFCGNTVFITNDKEYAKLRHTTPEYIVREVERARTIHPHLQSVLFYDDSFLGIPLADLTAFALLWRERVNLPFTVFGVIPTYVRRDKLEVLTWAGLNRVRMGIQEANEC